MKEAFFKIFPDWVLHADFKASTMQKKKIVKTLFDPPFFYHACFMPKDAVKVE